MRERERNREREIERERERMRERDKNITYIDIPSGDLKDAWEHLGRVTEQKDEYDEQGHPGKTQLAPAQTLLSTAAHLVRQLKEHGINQK